MANEVKKAKDSVSSNKTGRFLILDSSRAVGYGRRDQGRS